VEHHSVLLLLADRNFTPRVRPVLARWVAGHLQDWSQSLEQFHVREPPRDGNYDGDVPVFQR